jgi:hypothetical protein
LSTDFSIHQEWISRAKAFAEASDVTKALDRNKLASPAKIRDDIANGKIGEFIVYAAFRRLGCSEVSKPDTRILPAHEKTHDADLIVNSAGVSIKTCARPHLDKTNPTKSDGYSWVFQNEDVRSWCERKKPVVALVAMSEGFGYLYGLVSASYAKSHLGPLRNGSDNKKALYEKCVSLPWWEGAASVEDLRLDTRQRHEIFRAVLRWRERINAPPF